MKSYRRAEKTKALIAMALCTEGIVRAITSFLSFLFWVHLAVFWAYSWVCTQGYTLVVLLKPGTMPEKQFESAPCIASALNSVLFLHLYNDIFKAILLCDNTCFFGPIPLCF